MAAITSRLPSSPAALDHLNHRRHTLSQEKPGPRQEPIPDDLMLDPDGEEYRKRYRRLVPDHQDERDRVGADEEQAGPARETDGR